MTAKSFVSVSNIFEGTLFASIDISKLDVMFKAKCYVQFFKKFSHAHLDSVFDRHYDCINRKSTKEYACIDLMSKDLRRDARWSLSCFTLMLSLTSKQKITEVLFLQCKRKSRVGYVHVLQ